MYNMIINERRIIPGTPFEYQKEEGEDIRIRVAFPYAWENLYDSSEMYCNRPSDYKTPEKVDAVAQATYLYRTLLQAQKPVRGRRVK